MRALERPAPAPACCPACSAGSSGNEARDAAVIQKAVRGHLLKSSPLPQLLGLEAEGPLDAGDEAAGAEAARVRAKKAAAPVVARRMWEQALESFFSSES